MIYLDNAATTGKKPPEVLKAVSDALVASANPGRASHSRGRRALDTVYETREALSRLFKINTPERFVLTPNATYGLNFAIKGILKTGDHCITTAMEHNSVLRPLYSVKGLEITVLKGDGFGFIKPYEVLENIRENTKLIIINHSSNVNGVIQDIEGISRLLKDTNIPILIDASQTAGIIDISWEDFSLIAFPGHKGLYGPQGTGGLYVSPSIQMDTIIEGGTGSSSYDYENPLFLPDRFESGTLNTPGCAGLTKGIEFIEKNGIENILSYEHSLISALLNELLNMDKIVLYSPKDVSKLSNSLAFNIKGLDSSKVAHILDSRFDIGVRPGLHCAPLAHKRLGTLDTGAVRVSVSYFNTKEEIKRFIDAIYKIKNGV
ncbi:MAG: aminotransferase class V-fold PLP-dependent enzyme [Ruminococcaceae bacterium]|nr:aminotransferase class V-fold PLP-dependent enzyme [Oscillospiraceae bacterium]